MLNVSGSEGAVLSPQALTSVAADTIATSANFRPTFRPESRSRNTNPAIPIPGRPNASSRSQGVARSPLPPSGAVKDAAVVAVVETVNVEVASASFGVTAAGENEHEATDGNPPHDIVTSLSK
jgi:hypothetical protein